MRLNNEKSTGIDLPTREEINIERVSGLTQNLNVKQLHFGSDLGMMNTTKKAHNALAPGQAVAACSRT